MNTWMKLCSAVALCLWLGSPVVAGAEGSGSSVTGTISFDGKPPAIAASKVTKDNQVCGEDKPQQQLVVSKSGGIQNVVVYLEGVKDGKKAPKGTVTLNQKGCVYAPHVQVAGKGSKVELRSGDPVMHNVHGKHDSGRMLFNVGMPAGTKPVAKKLRRPGLSVITCDAGHTWMKAYIYVFDHPYYAVTKADGSFSIGDVPPGTYELVVWHELLGEKRQKVTVAANGASVAIKLKK